MTDQNQNSRNIDPIDRPMDKLFKLLPAELTATYLSIRAILPTENDKENIYLLIFGLIIIFFCPFFMRKLLGVTNKTQLVFLTFSLAIWMMNIDIQAIETLEGTVKGWVSSCTIAWPLTYIVNSIFVKGLLILWVGILVPLALGRAGQEGGTDIEDQPAVPTSIEGVQNDQSKRS